MSTSQQRRTRERAETRQLILDAAREMFVEHGYEATTMRAIADRIEYTPTAIYHHFKNKQELLTELCRADFLALASAFQRIGQIDDPIARLRQLGAAYIAFALEHPMQYQFLFMTRHPNVDEDTGITQGDVSEDAYAFLRQTCADVIDTGLLRSELRDADELAQIAWGALHGLLSLHIIKRDSERIEWRNPEKTARRICDLVMLGMLKDER